MALTEQEELELLELEEEEARTNAQKGSQQVQSTQQPQQNIQPQNILGQLMNVPGAAVRSAIQGTGYTQGALNPDQIPTFSKLSQEQFPIRTGNVGELASSIAFNAPMQAGAMAMDIATNPADLLISMAGGKIIEKGGQGIKALRKLFKYDNSLKQAEKAKVALDSLRSNLGQAKQIAMQEIKDLPVDFNWSNVPEKVLSAIKRPEYGIEFTQNGQIVNTINNLDKIKMALQDIPTTKDFVEAGNMAKKQIIQFSGKVRDAIVNTANKAGKPELSKALKDYHNFMDNYSLINDKLVDKYGNAMANKLKATFKWQAEPAIKEAWKEVGKSSSEVKSIMKSMNRRELLSNLLKYTGYGAVATGAVGGLSHLIKSD